MMKAWHHPGGKLRGLGASALTGAELLAILISTGIKGKSAENKLFCRHTYLATLAKLVAWNRLSDGRINNEIIHSILNGEFFRRQGLENFIEEDFFSWITRREVKEVGLEILRLITSLLNNYNVRELSQDVFKSLYQELVDPKTRHDLGEFYTPYWLASRIICKLLEKNERASFLDPSCGSATFLYLAIREKRNGLKDLKETLEHIPDSIFGIDIHPLVVIVAKTNYILALGDLLKKEGKKNIPIYLADTIKAPEKERAKDVKIPVWFNGKVYRVNIEKEDIYFLEAIIKNSKLYDEAIDCAKAFAVQNVGKIQYPIPGQQIVGKLNYKNSSLDEAEKKLLVKMASYYFNKRGKHIYWATEKEKYIEKESYYNKHFFQEATIVPRSFWFVEVKSLPMIGFNPAVSPLKSSERAKKDAKNNYKELVRQGNVECRYLYATLLSTDLLPFGHLNYRLVVLPIEPKENRYRILNAAEARKRQYVHLAQRLEKVEEEWNKRRGLNAEGMSAVEWLDCRNKLSSQNPQAKYRILYNTSGTFLCACMIENLSIEFSIGGQIAKAHTFISDTKTYSFETNKNNEAKDLLAELNAPLIDKLIKPMQGRGLRGPRDIHKRFSNYLFLSLRPRTLSIFNW